MIYFAAAVMVYILHLLLKLNRWISLVLLIYSMIMVRIHKAEYNKAKRNQKRFYDVSVYLDTVLYAFVKEEKVELAIRDVTQTLAEGDMKQLTKQALDYMTMTFDETEVLEEALQKIEKEYPCERIHAVHQFMTHVEYYGGEIEKPINLLLADKTRWEKRIKENIALRNKHLIDVILSAFASLCICGAIIYLPVMNIDIASEWVVQICSLAIVITNDFIVLRAQKFLSIDWIHMQLTEKEEYYVEKMEQLKNYDDKKEQKRSIILGSVGLLITAICFLLEQKWLVAGMLVISFFLFQQHYVGKSLLRRNLVKEIKYAFPNWLLDLVLLLQSENVQVALQKSQIHVPGVLRKDLIQLIEELEMQPEESEPYHRFLQEFAIPEVHSAMGILYSLSIGNSGNADKQISELVEKNLEMLDITEKELLQNSASGMYALFLMPVLTAAVKLVVDMFFLMMNFVAIPI